MKRVEEEILTVDDLAKLFSCDKETAAARLTCGDLPGVKVGRGWIIPRQALFERLNEKAREESAARRANKAPILDVAQQLSSAIQDRTRDAAPPTALMLSTGLNQRRRKRRIPPTLPLLKK